MIDLKEVYSTAAKELSHYDDVSWAIENGSELWKDLCKQDNKLYEIKYSGEGKELEFRVELEKFKVILEKIKVKHELADQIQGD